MRSFLIAGVLGIAALAFAGTNQAFAQHRHNGGHSHGYSGGFGNGMHDLTPHWHKTYTPFGTTVWYGNGLHDLLPHQHSYSPWSGVRSYSSTPFGMTKSYNGFPSYYGGYSTYGGYGGYGYGSYCGGYYRGW